MPKGANFSRDFTVSKVKSAKFNSSSRINLDFWVKSSWFSWIKVVRTSDKASKFSTRRVIPAAPLWPPKASKSSRLLLRAWKISTASTDLADPLAKPSWIDKTITGCCNSSKRRPATIPKTPGFQPFAAKTCTGLSAWTRLLASS